MAPSLSGTDATDVWPLTDEKLARVRHSQHTPFLSLSVKPEYKTLTFPSSTFIIARHLQLPQLSTSSSQT